MSERKAFPERQGTVYSKNNGVSRALMRGFQLWGFWQNCFPLGPLLLDVKQANTACDGKVRLHGSSVSPGELERMHWTQA